VKAGRRGSHPLLQGDEAAKACVKAGRRGSHPLLQGDEARDGLRLRGTAARACPDMSGQMVAAFCSLHPRSPLR
jgi:hypothetical protein